MSKICGAVLNGSTFQFRCDGKCLQRVMRTLWVLTVCAALGTVSGALCGSTIGVALGSPFGPYGALYGLIAGALLGAAAGFAAALTGAVLGDYRGWFIGGFLGGALVGWIFFPITGIVGAIAAHSFYSSVMSATLQKDGFRKKCADWLAYNYNGSDLGDKKTRICWAVPVLCLYAFTAWYVWFVYVR